MTIETGHPSPFTAAYSLFGSLQIRQETSYIEGFDDEDGSWHLCAVSLPPDAHPLRQWLLALLFELATRLSGHRTQPPVKTPDPNYMLPPDLIRPEHSHESGN